MSRLVHAIIHFRGQWIPGDERGFRSRAHRIHSGGDYRNPPPDDEHRGLREWVKDRMHEPVSLTFDESAVVGEAFVRKLESLGSRVLCLSCSATHVHVLYESRAPDAKTEVARAKQYASHQLKSRRGSIWARDCQIISVTSAGHRERSWRYIPDHAEKEGAWVYRCDVDAEVEGG